MNGRLTRWGNGPMKGRATPPATARREIGPQPGGRTVAHLAAAALGGGVVRVAWVLTGDLDGAVDGADTRDLEVLVDERHLAPTTLALLVEADGLLGLAIAAREHFDGGPTVVALDDGATHAILSGLAVPPPPVAPVVARARMRLATLHADVVLVAPGDNRARQMLASSAPIDDR